MKLNNIYFVSGIILITIGLWDFYYLRIMTEESVRTENQQLSPAITGAIILILSPLFQFNPDKIIILFVSFLFVITIAILIALTMSGTYVNFAYLIRHVFGIIFLGLVLIINIRQIKQGESQVK